MARTRQRLLGPILQRRLRVSALRVHPRPGQWVPRRDAVSIRQARPALPSHCSTDTFEAREPLSNRG